jgi:hypothetical protein
MPSPGFRVSGYVYGKGGVAIAGARVEVGSVASNRPFQDTDGSGFFQVEGVSGETYFRVTAQDYLPSTSSVTVTSDLTLTFNLTPSPLPAGTYRLTISASASNEDEWGFHENVSTFVRTPTSNERLRDLVGNGVC